MARLNEQCPHCNRRIADVPEGDRVEWEFSGLVMVFCSPECRDLYLESKEAEER